jgi:Peptidase family M28
MKLLFLPFLLFSLSALGAKSFYRTMGKIRPLAFASHVAVLSGEVPLRDQEGRNIGRITDRFSEGNLWLARRYLVEQVHQFQRDYADRGMQLVAEAFSIEHPYEPYEKPRKAARRIDGVNYYWELQGSLRPHEIVMLGAHYDTTGRGHPGANDNATGVAAVFEVTRAFLESGISPDRTIRFALFDAEELRTYEGSQFHFDSALKRGERFSIFINADMLGHSPSGRPYVTFFRHRFDRIDDLLQEANEAYGLGLSLEHDEIYESDQISAQVRGIPTVSIYEDPRDEDGEEVPYDPRNHTSDDRFEEINFDYAARVARFIGAVTQVAAQSQASWGNAQSDRRLARTLGRLSCPSKIVGRQTLKQ